MERVRYEVTRSWRPIVHWGVLLLAVVVSPACGHAAASDSIDEAVTAQLTQQDIPGAAVAVLQHGVLVKTGTYGFTDTARKNPVTIDTVFRLQSVSKQFTATAIMMLVEEGKLRLDDSILAHLDRAPESLRSITVRHLLSQTSGLRDFVNEATRDLTQDATDEEWLASVANRPLSFQPGERWDYSNTNYLLLGMILSKVTGHWYGDVLTTRIFEPLGMSHTSIARDRALAAQGFTRSNSRVVPSQADRTLSMSVLGYAGGGIQSTVVDLARWQAALLSERLVKRATLEQMWTPVKLKDGTAARYGFGWEIGAIGSHVHIWHAGTWTGFAARIDNFPADGLSVIVLTNLAESDPERISRAVAGGYVPDLAKPRYAPIEDKEPAVTSRLRDVLLRASEGDLREGDFTPSIWAYFSGNVEQVRLDFKAVGRIQELTLVERTNEGANRSYRYRARFPGVSFIYHFVLTPTERIDIMMPEL
jgi:CubicO group peptidase (beta-lactamase class C family)